MFGTVHPWLEDTSCCERDTPRQHDALHGHAQGALLWFSCAFA